MNHRPETRINGLYAITPDEADTPELLRKVGLALSGGARLFQYRNKAADAALRLEQAGALRKLTREYAARLIINDDAQLALHVDADGVHLGGKDGSVAAARALLGEDRLIGVSCYNRLSLAHEAELQGADYVAFGSFFASAVKPGAVSAAPDLLQQGRREISLPLVAIGGITLENANQLVDMGANALAVISALFGAADIRETTQQFLRFNYPESR